MTAGTKSVTLRRARENSGLTREQVCGQLKPPISYRTLERWEKAGVPERRSFWIEQLAELYGVTVESLNGKEVA